jgi:16S rRNA (uracil1498-N3)-methyltransferase
MRRQALEAVKQSGAAWATRVEEPVSLGELAARPLAGQGWVADANGAAVPAVVGEAPLTVVIGPEGGLTAEELERLRGAGYAPVSLGPHTLRFETAAIAAAAAAAAGRRRGDDG